MGACVSNESTTLSIISKNINSYYILGNVNSGKSTFLKSILIYYNYYNINTRKLCISKLIQNIIKEFMFSLIDTIIEYNDNNKNIIKYDILELINKLQATDQNEFFLLDDILTFQKLYKLNEITQILNLIEFEYSFNID